MPIKYSIPSVSMSILAIFWWTTTLNIYYMDEPYQICIYIYGGKVFHFDAFRSFRQQFPKKNIQKLHTNSREKKPIPIPHSNLIATSIKIKAWICCSDYKNKSFSLSVIARNSLKQPNSDWAPNAVYVRVDYVFATKSALTMMMNTHLHFIRDEQLIHCYDRKFFILMKSTL